MYVPEDRLDEINQLVYGSPATTEAAIEDLILAYNLANALIRDIKAMQDVAKSKLAEVMEETGSTTLTAKTGKAIITSSSVSISWNAKALDKLMAEDGLMRNKLSPFRTEKERPGTMRITAAN